MEKSFTIFVDADDLDHGKVNAAFGRLLTSKGVRVTFDAGHRNTCDLYVFASSKIHASPKYPGLVERYQKGSDRRYIHFDLRSQTVVVASGIDARILEKDNDLQNLVNEVKTEDDLPPLVQAYTNGNLCLFLGTGISSMSGLLSWGDTIRRFLVKSFVNDQEFLDFFENRAKQKRYNDVLEQVVSSGILSREEVIKNLKGLLLNKDLKTPKEILSLLQCEHLAGILTSSLDDFLARSLPLPTRTPDQGDRLLDDLSNGKMFGAQIFGSLEGKSLSIIPEEFRFMIGPLHDFAHFLRAVFYSKTILFMGCSIGDIEAILEVLPLDKKPEVPHFAIIPSWGKRDSDRGSMTEREWGVVLKILNQRYNLSFIHYERGEGREEHARLAALIGNIAQRFQEVDQTSKQSRDASASPSIKQRKITELRLEHFGPFEALDLKIDPNWNIIFGDNGVGKSHILKAVALAVCGDRAKPYAPSLINIRENLARITVKSQDLVFETTLHRGSDLSLDVAPFRMLENFGGLIMGFPALRSARNLDDPRLGLTATRRSIEWDVLPLLQGDLDSRMRHLKEWLVELSHDILALKEQDPERSKYLARLRDKVFEVISKLSVGVVLKFGRIEDKRVYVQTYDGEVPLESVSQGMISLFGWVGLLVRRLFEVYHDEEEPTHSPALVLIDEIDAHMHP
nr:AAA family ATPase [Acidobacteriota bacterium]